MTWTFAFKCLHIVCLTCQMIQQDRMTKGSINFMGWAILLHNFNDYKEKNLSTKLCDVLISSHKVTKFWIWREWHHTREHTKHFMTTYPCIFLLILWKRNLLHTFMVILTIIHELMKLKSFEWLNCVST